MEKCTTLEHELGEYKRDIEKVVGEFEKEKVCLIASVEDMDKLTKKVPTVNKILDSTYKFMNFRL